MNTPLQSFSTLYVVRNLSGRPHHKAVHLVSHYDVCYTKTGELVRITSVVAVKPGLSRQPRNRVYRSAQPEVWETVRTALLNRDHVFFESSVLDLMGQRKHPTHK